MNPAFKQIGAAVPPLRAKTLADQIYKLLKGTKDGEETCNQEAYAV
jgi:site-specific DNA-cytosine methylase